MAKINSATQGQTDAGALPRIGSDPSRLTLPPASSRRSMQLNRRRSFLPAVRWLGARAGSSCDRLIDVWPLVRRAAESSRRIECRAAPGHLADGGEGRDACSQQPSTQDISCRREKRDARRQDRLRASSTRPSCTQPFKGMSLIEGEAFSIVGDNGDLQLRVAKQRMAFAAMQPPGLPRQKFFGGHAPCARFGSGQAPYTKAAMARGG